MLFPMWATQGWMQPFRFVDLPGGSRETLDMNLKSFLGETAKDARRRAPDARSSTGSKLRFRNSRSLPRLGGGYRGYIGSRGWRTFMIRH